jgi:hypothetical protein
MAWATLQMKSDSERSVRSFTVWGIRAICFFLPQFMPADVCIMRHSAFSRFQVFWHLGVPPPEVAYNLHMGSPFDRQATLLDDAAQLCLDFIRTDLQVCLTLTSVAETAINSGNPEHSARTIATAERGYSTLLRFFSRTKHLTREAREELQ